MKSARVRHFFFCLLICVVMICAVEVAARVLYFVLYNTWTTPFSDDREVGWIVRPHYSSTAKIVDSGGRRYVRKLETGELGFRSWGDRTAKKTKILFIGDSFTFAYDVANEKTYYEVFRQKFLKDIEVFAYGSGGYGTLQEYIILNRVFELVDPDIIILQFCNNDFENNSLAMERKSIVLSQTIRPYLQNDRIVFRYSRFNPYALLLHHSLTFAFVDSRIQMLRYRLNKGYAPEPPADIYQESVEITGKIFQMIKKRLRPGTQLFVFNANSKSEGRQYADLERLAGAYGIVMLPDVAKDLFEAQKKGLRVRAADGGHWSDLGHEIVGRGLADYFAHIIKK